MKTILPLSLMAALLAPPAWAQEPVFDLTEPLAAAQAALQDAQKYFLAQNRPQPGQQDQPREREARGRDAQWDAAYERARQAIERAQWSQALQQFTVLAQANAPRSDAAMYWRAYAFDKMNRYPDALAAVGELLKNFPSSRWVADGRALELQVRQRSGQPVPVDTGDEDLKLLALQGLQQIAPERAVPMLMKVMSDVGSLRLKERALFVLSQSSAPDARATLEKVARGAGNPELQVKAVQYIAMSGQPGRGALLNDIYAGAADMDVKLQVLRAFTMAGDRQRVLTAAQTEKTPELRAEAVRQLGMLGAKDELWQMYQKESDAAVKRMILNSLAMSGATPRIIEIATADRDAGLRVAAVRQLGMFGGSGVTSTLTSIYAKEQDHQVKRAAIDGLFFLGNADALITIAKGEKDPTLRRELVQKLSMMKSPAVLEYLTDILNK